MIANENPLRPTFAREDHCFENYSKPQAQSTIANASREFDVSQAKLQLRGRKYNRLFYNSIAIMQSLQVFLRSRNCNYLFC